MGFYERLFSAQFLLDQSRLLIVRFLLHTSSSLVIQYLFSCQVCWLYFLLVFWKLLLWYYFVKWINIMTYEDAFCKMVRRYNDEWRSWKWPLLTFQQSPHIPENEFESTFVFFIFSEETIFIFSIYGQKRAFLYKYLIFSDIFLHLNLNGIHLEKSLDDTIAQGFKWF